MTMVIEIPALDRLCAWLESRDKAAMCAELEAEIVDKLKEAAMPTATATTAAMPTAAMPTTVTTTPRPEFKEVAPDADHPWKDEAASEPREAPSEPPKPEPTNAPDKPAASEPAPKPVPTVTLDAVQRAAAELRDQGKLKAVTDLFPEFGIKKLSDLKGDKLGEFAGRLRQMGANV